MGRASHFLSVFRDVFCSGALRLEDRFLFSEGILRGHIVRLITLGDDVVEVDIPKESVILNIFHSVLEVAVPFRKIMISEVAN